ncbi:hypothetical protein RND71_043984 [Anisodus tanguticus]|uniref:MI domain-containing protein n=1 Tax=Anisodus tanguticus TaxID=243964 RepID=A0AAE1UTS4_9SOLA|nr:hypothetical protein RND71_043984 [Anisodus tanguticus]
MATNKVINASLLMNGVHEKCENLKNGKFFPEQVVLKSNKIVESDDDLSDPINGLNHLSDTSRFKNKNKRITKSCDYPEENANGFSTAALSASLPDHFTFNGNFLKYNKKFSKNSRRSRKGKRRGLAKKGGAGGKGTWGKLVDVEEKFEDPSDINYDSDNQENCEYIVIIPPLTDEEIDRHVTSLITEYFEHGDTEEIAFSLEEFNFDKKQSQIIVIAVTLAMEHKSSHRELTSVLISDLYDRILKEKDFDLAFKILLKSLPDLVLDTPEAPVILGNFIARSIADDCLPPNYVQKIQNNLDGCEHAKACLEHISSLLDSKYAMMKLDTVWGIAGGMRPVIALISRIQLLLFEYICSGEIEEATRCLKELEVPHFHHELVYEAIVYALEDMKKRTLVLIVDLFEHLYKTVIITVDQFSYGFNRVYEEFHDISIDVPLADPLLKLLVSKCASKGFLAKELIEKFSVSKGRKRFVSEGDGGKFKEDYQEFLSD